MKHAGSTKQSQPEVVPSVQYLYQRFFESCLPPAAHQLVSLLLPHPESLASVVAVAAMRAGILLCACIAVGAAAQQQSANGFGTVRPGNGAAQGAAAQPAAADDKKPVVSGPIKLLPTPDKVDLLKQVTDPQLDGENTGRSERGTLTLLRPATNTQYKDTLLPLALKTGTVVHLPTPHPTLSHPLRHDPPPLLPAPCGQHASPQAA